MMFSFSFFSGGEVLVGVATPSLIAGGIFSHQALDFKSCKSFQFIVRVFVATFHTSILGEIHVNGIGEVTLCALKNRRNRWLV